MELELFLAKSTSGFSLPLLPTIQLERHFPETEEATKARVSDVLLVPATREEGENSEPATQLTNTTQRNRAGI